MSGIKETKELLVGVNEVGLVLMKHFKDGVQFKDALELFESIRSNPELLAKLYAAYEGYGNLPMELNDLDIKEGIELAQVQLEYLPKLVDALKKEQAA